MTKFLYKTGFGQIESPIQLSIEETLSKKDFNNLNPSEVSLVHEFFHFVQNFTELVPLIESIYVIEETYGCQGYVSSGLSLNRLAAHKPHEEPKWSGDFSVNYSSDSGIFTIYNGFDFETNLRYHGLLENQLYLFEKSYREREAPWQYRHILESFTFNSLSDPIIGLVLEYTLMHKNPQQAFSKYFRLSGMGQAMENLDPLIEMNFNLLETVGEDLKKLYTDKLPNGPDRASILCGFVDKGIELRKNFPLLFSQLISLNNQAKFELLSQILVFLGTPIIFTPGK